MHDPNPPLKFGPTEEEIENAYCMGLVDGDPIPMLAVELYAAYLRGVTRREEIQEKLDAPSNRPTVIPEMF